MQNMNDMEMIKWGYKLNNVGLKKMKLENTKKNPKLPTLSTTPPDQDLYSGSQY